MTDFLYAMPKFVSGMGRVIDIGGTMTVFNNSDTEVETDTRAIYSDWLATGDDMRKAMEKV